ncbi:MAG: BREX-2 system phosphatase PglZ, partial [Desulfobacterales bacterium]|nr:BREX-2 system phosphatase PglZ [Desulfobacterales bacterium]
DQLNISWRVEDVPALAKLLFMARQTGRTVILTSDHGHVLDHGAKFRRYDAGERWRPDDGAPRAGEIAIRGDRVLRPANGKMIAPWSEHLRYRAKKKNGYHGGLTPQEVIVPLAAMKPRPVEKGWTERPFYEPEWWSPRVETPRPPARPRAPAASQKRFEEKYGEMPLFSAVEEGEAPGPDALIDALLRSPILLSQKKLCARAPVADETMRAFLHALDSHGGAMLQTALAQAVGRSRTRVRGVTAMMQRLLNVDGWPVLSLDSASDTVRIDYQLLKEQFEI